jgi:hypothetical protein
MVNVLAIGPKVRRFKPDRGRSIFQGDNNPQDAFPRRRSRFHIVRFHGVKDPYEV